MIDTLVVDDLRVFPFDATYARTSRDGLTVINSTDHIGDLWLDHDLGGTDTIGPVVDRLVERAVIGPSLTVDRIFVHSANVSPDVKTIVLALERRYPWVRRVDAGDYGGHVPN